MCETKSQCGKTWNSLPCNFFRQISFRVNFFSKKLIWWNFCEKIVAVKFRNFHSCAVLIEVLQNAITLKNFPWNQLFRINVDLTEKMFILSYKSKSISRFVILFTQCKFNWSNMLLVSRNIFCVRVNSLLSNAHCVCYDDLDFFISWWQKRFFFCQQQPI